MKRSIYALVSLASVIAMLTAGCSVTVNQVETGALQTENINLPIPADASQVWDVELLPGAASVEVEAGSEALLEGTIAYNVESWRPSVTTADRRVTVKQDEFVGVPPIDAHNEWKLKLGKGVPINLLVREGAVRGEMDLGGLQLRTLDYRQGAADATLAFSQPNLTPMSSFRLDAGASRLRVEGLANSRSASGYVVIGAGGLTLRFNGALKQDMDITIEGGAAAVTIETGGNPVEVIVSEGLTAVNASGWSNVDKTYRSPEWQSAKGAKITVRARLGAATLNLVSGK